MSKNNNSSIIKNILLVKKLTGAKIAQCRKAVEESESIEDAVKFLKKELAKLENTKKIETDTNYNFCKIDKLEDNVYIYISFSAHTEYVIKYIKNFPIKDLISSTNLTLKELKSNKNINFVNLKEELEKHLTSLTKEKVVLNNCKIFNKKNFIFYNNLNGSSCSYIDYDLLKEEEKIINYKILHTDINFKLSRTENIIKNLCSLVNCLEKEDINKINLFLKGELKIEDIEYILDVFPPEKPVVYKIDFLTKNNVVIKEINKFLANE